MTDKSRAQQHLIRPQKNANVTRVTKDSLRAYMVKKERMKYGLGVNYGGGGGPKSVAASGVFALFSRWPYSI